jgi:hypothetical protein
LGRGPRPLEARLSSEERAAYDADVEALRNEPFDPNNLAAGRKPHQSILDRAWQRWGPLFKAGGIERVDSPADFRGIAGSFIQPDWNRAPGAQS